MKNFLSHSRERLDNFVGKFSSKSSQHNHKHHNQLHHDALAGDQQQQHMAASVGAGLDNYRAVQQKKRREGTLSPRSSEYQYMIKELCE